MEPAGAPISKACFKPSMKSICVIRGWLSRLIKLLCFSAEAFFQFSEFRSELRAEVFCLEDWLEIDFAFHVRSFGIVRYPLRPLERFFHRVNFPDPETGDQLACFREWTIRNDSPPARKLDALCLR